MEPTVRNPRIESATITDIAGNRSKLASRQAVPGLVRSAPNSSRQERNFWMQRLEAKNPPERPVIVARDRNVENRSQDPRRNGLFSIDDGFRGSGRLGGGVRSQMRTGLRLAVPWYQGILQGILRFWGSETGFSSNKALRCSHFSSNSLRKLTAKVF